LKQSAFPSVHDRPIKTLAKAIASSAKALPPLGRVTILVGNDMNMTYWPHSRSYISFSKSISGQLILGLSHYSEVKHIKRFFRHEMPASLGWQSPEISDGHLIHSWHKPLINNASIPSLAKAFADALDDCHLTYTQSEDVHQNLYFLNEEAEYFSAGLRKSIGAGRGCSWLAPEVEQLLRQDDEIQVPDEILASCEAETSGISNKNHNYWVVVNHRGYVTELIQQVIDHKGEHWFGEKDGIAIPIKKPKCGIMPIRTDIASRLWSGEKVGRLMMAREEL
jgi:hypothetical protein